MKFFFLDNYSKLQQVNSNEHVQILYGHDHIFSSTNKYNFSFYIFVILMNTTWMILKYKNDIFIISNKNEKNCKIYSILRAVRGSNGAIFMKQKCE